MYYFEIVVNIDDLPERMSYCSKTFNIIHPILNNFVGISFPEWGVSGIGGVIRCFSNDPELLNSILHTHKLLHLAENDVIIIKSVNKVPENALPVRYVRDRRIEKRSESGFFTREKKRGVSDELILKRIDQVNRGFQYTKNCNYVKVNSLSNRNQFSLFIRKEPVSDDDLKQIDVKTFQYSGYGLSDRKDLESGKQGKLWSYVYEW